MDASTHSRDGCYFLLLHRVSATASCSIDTESGVEGDPGRQSTKVGWLREIKKKRHLLLVYVPVVV